MLRSAANDIGPVAVWLNETTVPLSGANLTVPPPALVCGCTTRKVSASAVLETDSASTAPRRTTSRLIATAGRRPGVSAARRSPQPRPGFRPQAPPAPPRPRDPARDRAEPRPLLPVP